MLFIVCFVFIISVKSISILAHRMNNCEIIYVGSSSSFDCFIIMVFVTKGKKHNNTLQGQRKFMRNNKTVSQTTIYTLTLSDAG